MRLNPNKHYLPHDIASLLGRKERQLTLFSKFQPTSNPTITTPQPQTDWAEPTPSIPPQTNLWHLKIGFYPSEGRVG